MSSWGRHLKWWAGGRREEYCYKKKLCELTHVSVSTPPLQAHLVGNENQKGAYWLTLEGDYCCHSQQVYTLKPHVSLAHGGALALVVDSCDPPWSAPRCVWCRKLWYQALWCWALLAKCCWHRWGAPAPWARVSAFVGAECRGAGCLCLLGHGEKKVCLLLR